MFFSIPVSQQNVIYMKAGQTQEVTKHFMIRRELLFFILGNRSGSILQVPEISPGQKFV